MVRREIDIPAGTTFINSRNYPGSFVSTIEAGRLIDDCVFVVAEAHGDVYMGMVFRWSGNISSGDQFGLSKTFAKFKLLDSH